jgi:cell division cycle protein 20 (cofactor of APC complex)
MDVFDDNIVTSVLYSSVFLFNRKNQKISLASCLEGGEVLPTCVKFRGGESSLLAVGSDTGELHMVDFHRNTKLLSRSLHTSRIGCIDWNTKCKELVATGSKDKTIGLCDVRYGRKKSVNRFSHFGEICGLKWSPNGIELASGGNDNLIHIWDLRNLSKPKATIKEHSAAVRALDWCPWEPSLLASGGGSGDMRLLVHDTLRGGVERSVLTSSQVCALLWEEESQKLLSAHGFSKYQICLWDLEKEQLLYEFLGHRNRVLSLAKTKGSSLLFSASADETLRVWNIKEYVQKFVKKESILSPKRLR